MPTYTYQCSDCGVSFEQVQKFSDAPLTTCPSCAGSVRRIIHPVGVVFKGSGWYINDSRPAVKSGSEANGAKDDAPAASGKKPEAASESTPAKAAEPAKAAAAD